MAKSTRLLGSARVGEAYIFRIHGGGYGAVHVVAEKLGGTGPLVGLLLLDLDSPQPPTAEDILESAPARRTSTLMSDFEKEVDHCCWVDALPPWWAQRVEGLTLPPREVDAINSYGGWLSVSLSRHFTRRERRGRGMPPWEPQLVPVLDLGGETVKVERCARYLDLRGLLPPEPAPVRWEGLWALTQADRLTHEGPDRGLLSTLATFPCPDLSWHRPRDPVLDLRDTRPVRVGVYDVDRPLTLCLSNDTYHLTLSGQLEQVRVQARDLGAQFGLTVMGGKVEALPRDLEALHVLTVVAKQPFDLALLPRACPGLTDLVLRVPGVRSLSALRECRRLRTLTAYDLYDLDAQAFPSLAEWPACHELEICGLRATAAKVLRQRLKGLAGLKLSKARSDQWLAENIDNPFRDWDADGLAFGKKAMKLWTVALRQAVAFTEGVTQAQAEEVVRSLVHGLNHLGAIDTLRREEACDAIQALMRDHLCGALNPQATEELVDRLRDF